MTLATIKRRLKLWKPQTLDGLIESCRFPLEYISCGMYRKVYGVVGTEYVIKVPIQDETRLTNISHAVDEYREYKRMSRLKKYAAIKHRLPKFHYFDSHSGISLVERYKSLYEWDTSHDKTIRQINAWLKSKGFEDSDLDTEKRDNFGLDAKGNLKILDLGCLYT